MACNSRYGSFSLVDAVFSLSLMVQEKPSAILSSFPDINVLKVPETLHKDKVIWQIDLDLCLSRCYA